MFAGPHQGFTTTSAKGLRHDSVPMRLYQEAKRLGAWDPRGIGLRQDSHDWGRLQALERDLLLRLTALFQAGEESLTLDPPALLMRMVREDRFEEEMFLTTFLSEKAKHTEFFRRFLDEVCRAGEDLHRYHTPSFRKLFYEQLPQAMNRLLDDPSLAAQAEAVVRAMVIGEGVLAAIGYHVYATVLRPRKLMPGLMSGLSHMQRDETRHVEYGLFVLARLAVQDTGMRAVIAQQAYELLADALDTIREFFEPYPAVPFGLSRDAVLEYAIGQFSRCSTMIEKAIEREPAALTVTTELHPGGAKHRHRNDDVNNVPSAGARGYSDSQVQKAVEAVLDWINHRVAPVKTSVTKNPSSRVYVFRLEQEGVESALLLTEEIFERHSVQDIIAALSEHQVAKTLHTQVKTRLICLRAGNHIVVQQGT